MNKKEVKFFPLDIKYNTSESGKVEIKLFGETLDRQKIIISDSFLPYFWVILENGVDVNKLVSKIKKASSLIVDTKLENKRYIEKKVKAIKVYANNIEDLRKIKSEIKLFKGIYKIRELDISPQKKYLIDNKLIPYTLCEVEGEVEKGFGDIDWIITAKKIKQVSSDLIRDVRILAFDIETLCIGPSPNPNEDAIIMCSFYGSNNFQKIITWNPVKNAKIVAGEKELIEEIVNTIKEFDPEILVGYGSDFFDFPYIRERAKKYNINLNLGWDGTEPTTRLRSRRGVTRIIGINHLDISHFIRNVLGNSLEVERFDLNRVGKVMLNLEKTLDLKKVDINQLWNGTEKDLERLAEYNLRDSEITFKIAEKILPTQFQLAKLLSLTLFDIDRMTYSQLVEQFLIKNAPEFNQICPARPNKGKVQIRRAYTYSGGFVFEPKAKVYENIGSFDYRSLYPSIIAAYNIGPTTINCSCCKNSAKKIRLDGKEYWFCNKKEGFFSSLIKNLVERRKRIKHILKITKKTDPSYPELNSLSYALKTLANASYGYMGFPGSRWYCLECARAITFLGREYINKVINTANKLGLEVIYADTDGALMLLKDNKNIKKFLNKINSTLPEPMELEYQGKYKRGLFLEKKSGGGGAKKRYALLSENGDIILKGIEAIRGDWSPLAKKAQRKVIEIILKEKSVKKAANYIKKLINKVEKRKVELYDLAIESTLTKNIEDYSARGPHVAAAEQAKKKGYAVGRGFTVSYIVCEGTGRINERVKLTEDADIKDYDIEYYVENQIIRAVYKIFELFNYSKDKLRSGQASLNSF